MSKAVIFFAEGLEECEGLLVVDLLRRAGVEVTIAALGQERSEEHTSELQSQR